MRILDITHATPEADLAFDESLFRALEAAGDRSGAGRRQALRVWESPRPVVVLGRGGRLNEEVDVAACAGAGVEILRRASGGGSVVLGPGCLCFALVLAYRDRPELRDVARSYGFVLGGLISALRVPGLERRGQSDLALGGRKVSGNAQLRGRHGLLHQGTILHGFDPALAIRFLREPRRQPAYRAGRRHPDFLGSLPLPAQEVRSRLLGFPLARDRMRTDIPEGVSGVGPSVAGSIE